MTNWEGSSRLTAEVGYSTTCGPCEPMRFAWFFILWIKAFDIWHPQGEQSLLSTQPSFLPLCFTYLLRDSKKHLTWSDCNGDEKFKTKGSKSYKRNTCKRRLNPEGGPLGSRNPGDRQRRCSAGFRHEGSRVHFHRRPWLLNKSHPPQKG